MKKITFLVLMIFATANSYSQTYSISFIATGAAVSVDSVKVENLTHPASAIWHAGDVLQMIVTTAISEIDKNNQSLHVYPNPMQGQAEISFYARQTGNATISIYDIAGKKVLQTENKLLQGNQKYLLVGLKQGLYFINIIGDAYFYTAKLICQNAIPNETKFKYLGCEKPEVALTTLKSTNATVTMEYYIGDNIRFNGYALNHSTIVNDVLTGSKIIGFFFTTTTCPPTITDIDGNTYNTVSIGSQCWMRENLKTTKYRNGSSIPNVPDSLTWRPLTTGAYCDYNNTPGNSLVYGKLYNFYAVIDSSNLCPTGWHVPSDLDWTTLTTFLGGEAIAGGKLKEAGLAHWVSPNTAATNETGFSALPGGHRYEKGAFYDIGENGYWWSTAEYNTLGAWSRSMCYDFKDSFRHGYLKYNGFSVRCLRD
ncbi:MAG: FISUMP domain-containing protein [Bacteroidales bacterium]